MVVCLFLQFYRKILLAFSLQRCSNFAYVLTDII